MKKEYKTSEFLVEKYGYGKNVKFIVYTDWDETIHRWRTKVYVDATTKTGSIKEAKEILYNGDEPWIRRGEFKISIVYDWKDPI